MPSSENDRKTFERSARSLETEIANAGAHLTIDGTARFAYTREIRRMTDKLREGASSGKISWAEAAEEAQEARNVVMEIIRGRSTPVGRAIAQRLKAEGKTLNELIARQTAKQFGAHAEFARLPPGQQNSVYAAIVASAGKSNPKVTAAMGRLAHCGRGLLVVSLAMSVYTIANADDKVEASKAELAYTGAGIGGGVAGGALAGLACGPGAPACVTVGAFVGGALAAFGVSFAF
jgi:hypothetical protein